MTNDPKKPLPPPEHQRIPARINEEKFTESVKERRDINTVRDSLPPPPPPSRK